MDRLGSGGSVPAALYSAQSATQLQQLEKFKPHDRPNAPCTTRVSCTGNWANGRHLVLHLRHTSAAGRATTTAWDAVS